MALVADMSKSVPIKIRFTEPIPGVYSHLQPVIGEIYDAAFFPGSRVYGRCHTEVCIITVKGKPIAVRKGEYERVED